MPPELTWLVLFIIAVALVFDFINGFHDAANSIATVVSTQVLSPLQAVVWAAFFNFAAAFCFGVGVAKTISSGLIDIHCVNEQVILAGLTGAIVWDLVTWWLGLPTSSSHALIGGYVGAAVAKAGIGSLIATAAIQKASHLPLLQMGEVLWKDKLIKTVFFIFLSPVIGLLLGAGLMIGMFWIFRRTSPSRVDFLFRKGQLFSAAAYSLGHGGNDAQKTMGIVMGLLISVGFYDKKMEIPWWLILSCHAAIGLGTLFGGWRIVKTMGQKITKLRPVGGFCAETGGAISLFLATHLGIPVSTTHTITGAILGVGSANRISAVRCGVAGRIVWAWVLTIPADALIAAGAYLLLPA